MTRSESVTALSAAVLITLTPAASAFDQPPVNLGFTSFLDGAPPAGPGLYFQQYLQYYTSDEVAGGNGKPLVLPTARGTAEQHDVDAFVSLTQLVYQSTVDAPFGAKWGMNVIVPHASFDVSPADTVALPENDSGFGDLLLGPFVQWDPIMGANGPRFVHRVEFQFILPTGKHDRNKALNPGANHFSFNPYWSGTYWFTPRWTASWRAHYLWNGENEDPSPALGAADLQPGQAVHANLATAYEVLPNRLRLGLNGYFLRQITDTEINGVDAPGRRERVYGIGPGGVLHLTRDTHLFANAYFEFGAENRTEGQRYNLRLVHHF